MNLEDFRSRYEYNLEKDLIGTGGFSKVYKAYDKEEEKFVALKFYFGELDERYGVLSEMKKVIHIDHPNLIKYHDAVLLNNPNIYDSKGQIQVGIIEYANAGDLNAFMKTFPSLRQINKVVKDILEGLNHLHLNNIVHRDIKPQNILLHEENGTWTAKIADFGLAKRVRDQSRVSSKLLGTMEYMAPEQFNTVKYGISNKLGTNVDLWAFGVILFELFTGELPFGGRNDGTTQQQLMFKIMQDEVRLNEYDIIQPYRNLIRMTLIKKAPNRVQTAQELIDILEGRASGPAQADTIALDPHKVALTPNQKMWIFLGSLFLTPLFGVIFYFKYRKKYQAKALASIDIAWWALITILGAMVFIVGTMIVFDIGI